MLDHIELKHRNYRDNYSRPIDLADISKKLDKVLLKYNSLVKITIKMTTILMIITLPQ